MYNFGVLLIQLVNGSPFVLDGNKILIQEFIQWAQKVHAEENGFQQIFNVVIGNSIIGYDCNETKLFLQKSLQMHQGNFSTKSFMCIIQFVIKQI